jgi:hypothetical protein
MIRYICELQLGSHPVAVIQCTVTHKQYTEQHKNLRTTQKFGKVRTVPPSLRILPWHFPYNWGKGTEKPQSGTAYFRNTLYILASGGAKWSPSSTFQALFFFSIRCLLVIMHYAQLRHELGLGSTDSTATLFETWIKPIIIWRRRRQYSSVDLSTSMLLPMFFDPFHFLNGAQNVDCRMACHSGATPLGPPFYQELVNNTEIQIPS